MKDLIAKLEAALGGSEALDKDIARSLGFLIAASTGGPHIMRSPAKVGDPSWDLPKYSRSTDAARALVPEGWRFVGLWEAVKPEDRPWWGCQLGRDKPYWMLPSVLGAKSPAVAICIAALKAREAK